MQPGKPSGTAHQAALLRAAHRLLDKPSVFDDNLAGPLCGLDGPEAVLETIGTLRDRLVEHGSIAAAQSWLTAARATVVVRARWAEDQLLAAIESRQVSQYVILGAGLDSFAYRRPDLAASLHVFEVDHGATQADKLARLQRAGISVPGNLRFVAVDLERQSLLKALQEAGYSAEQPAFFSCLGVAMYLRGDAIRQVLRQIASGAGGTLIALNYVVPPHLLHEPEDLEVQRMLKGLIAHQGEPAHSELEPAQIAALLRECGFSEISDLAHKEITARYGMKISALTHLVLAGVPDGPRGFRAKA